MSGVWIKIWTDLWGNKIRTTLAVLSIAAGVFAVGAMFGIADLIRTGMDTSHQASRPAHLLIHLSDYIDRDTALRLKKISGVAEIEVLNEARVRYKIKPEDEWAKAVVVMRDDYERQLFDIYQLRAGAWPQKKHFGIERKSSEFFNIGLGDEILFEVEGRAKKFSINGIIRHPFVPPPEFGGEAYFLADAQGMAHFGEPEGKYIELRVQVAPYSPALAREIAAEVKSRLSKEGIGLVSTFYQDPQKHWGGTIMDSFLMILKVLAVVSLGASVVLVLNTLNAIIAQQTNQIGIIKAIGGTAGVVIKIYLAVVLVYGLLALLLALPLSALVAFNTTKQFLGFFNIDYSVFQVSRQALVYQAIAAMMVPLLAALWPVLRGTAITVREALASYGLGSDFGASWLDRFVEGVAQRFFAAPYAIALGNMFRRKGRLILTQVVLITAGTMAVVVMSLSASVTLTLDNVLARNKYDTIIFFKEDERIDRVVTLAQSLSEVKQAEVRFGHPASILKAGQRAKEAGLGTELVGIPASSAMFQPLLVAGRWLLPHDDRAVVMSKDTGDDNNIKLGDTITLDLNELGQDDWQVVGFYHDIFAGKIDNVDALYANQEAVCRATKKYNRGRNLFVRTYTHQVDDVAAVTARLKDLYNAGNIEVHSSQTAPESRQEIEGQFGVTISMMLVVAIIMAIVGGIGLMGALSIGVVERTREIGVMRTIGARTYTIMNLFVLEGVLQGLMSWLLVVPLSFVLGKPLSNAVGQIMFSIDMDYQYNVKALFIWLAIVLIISVLASMVPARSATRISVRQSLAYQ
ncbi:MAG: FtsX-like permease family protein [Anaerolineae bacterium]|nr:FtsX-like permease family protein [Anaerolineae bacterium]